MYLYLYINAFIYVYIHFVHVFIYVALAVELTTTGESVHLTWSPPSVTEGASITGYEASIAITEEMRVIKYSSSEREVAFDGLQPLTVYEVELRVRVSSGSSSLLQPFYSTNVTIVEKSNTEAVVNGVVSVETIVNGVVGAAVMLFIVGVVTVFMAGAVIVGCFIRKKRRMLVEIRIICKTCL